MFDQIKNYLTYNEPSKLLIREYPYITTKTSHKIKIKANTTTTITTTLLYLKGIVYYRENHFTSIIISKDGRIWFKDGVTTGGKSNEEGHLLSTMIDKNLKKCKGKYFVLAYMLLRLSWSFKERPSQSFVLVVLLLVLARPLFKTEDVE